jgi:hypothetical protein
MNARRPQLSVREAVARSYPGWDRDRADRLLLWLDECGYTIVEKEPKHGEAALVPDDSGDWIKSKDPKGHAATEARF